jgi:hypothetical protein
MIVSYALVAEQSRIALRLAEISYREPTAKPPQG